MRQQGTQVTLVATPDSGQRFARWELVEGGTAINSPTNPQMTFTMPAQNVTFKAVFEADDGTGTPPSQQQGTSGSQVTMPPVTERPLPPSEQTPQEIQNGMNLPDTSDPLTLTLVFGGLAAVPSLFVIKPKKEDEEAA